MAEQKLQPRHSTPAYAVTAGTSTAYTATIANLTLQTGQSVSIKPHTNCGASPTLNINGLGAKALKKDDGTALASGDIKSTGVYTFVYDGTDFYAQDKLASQVGGSSSKINVGTSASTSTNASATVNYTAPSNGFLVVQCSLRGGYVVGFGSNAVSVYNNIDSQSVSIDPNDGTGITDSTRLNAPMHIFLTSGQIVTITVTQQVNTGWTQTASLLYFVSL